MRGSAASTTHSKYSLPLVLAVGTLSVDPQLMVAVHEGVPGGGASGL